MVSSHARDPEVGVPISGIGGIETWRDAAEFLLLGATSVQVCTAVMHFGYRIVEDMIDGLSNWLEEKGVAKVTGIVGRAVPNVTDWGKLDLRYNLKARVDYQKCIGCNLCFVACEDGAHQAIELDGPAVRTAAGETRPGPRIVDEECVGCNLCSLVCPVQGCISMARVDTYGEPLSWDEMKARGLADPYAEGDHRKNWLPGARGH
jgi:dihydropyrimidine dehydrogenase (NAD+) subunit PreA